MYEEYYGFVQPPFSLTPDPRFLYRSASHDLALQQVWQAIRRKEGFLVLSGDIGTGKTTLCRTLLEQFDQTTFTALILNPFLSVEELLREVLLNFGVASKDALRSGRLATASKHELVRTLHDFLLSLVPLHGSAVLIIDEAQHLSPDVLEEIRILSNLETNDQKLLQIVLVGQLNLLDTLAKSELRQLDQRISIRCKLKALTREEVEAYVTHRLWVARGSTSVSFTSPAFDLVHAISGGVPRRINLLCDRALMAGCEARTSQIAEELILKAAAQLNLDVPKGTAQGAIPATSAALRVLIVVVVVAILIALAAAAYFVSNLRDGSGPAVQRPPAPLRPATAAALPAPADLPVIGPPSAMPGSFSVLVGTYDSARQVASVDQALRSLRLPIYMIDVRAAAGGVFRRVLVGRFPTREAADAARQKLGAEMNDARVIPGWQEQLPVVP